MQDDGFRKIIKKTEFFEKGKFLSFGDDLANPNYRIKINPQKVTELIIKCSGYGYFQYEGKTVQSQIKRNLIKYLEEATQICQNIKIFKLDLSGFSIDRDFLEDLLKLVSDIFNKKQKRQTIWIHTRYLRDCVPNDVTQMLQLINKLVSINNSEEISVIMSGWQFQNDPLQYFQLTKILKQFSQGLKPDDQPFLKRLKIDISSWYVHNLEAYNLLSKTVTSAILEERLENSRHDANCSIESKSAIKEEQLKRARSKIKEYVEGIDNKFAIENPIPGKQTPFINFQKEFKAQRFAYLQSIYRKAMSKQDRQALLAWLDSDWGLPEQHRKKLKEIEQAIKGQCKKQEDKYKKDQGFVENIDKLQQFISQKFVRFPFEQVIKVRVNAFHKFILDVMGDICSRLASLQQFQWDMRNWNAMFDMGDLKKELDKNYGNSEGLKIIDNPITGTPRLLQRQMDQQQKAEQKKSLIVSFIV